MNKNVLLTIFFLIIIISHLSFMTKSVFGKRDLLAMSSQI